MSTQPEALRLIQHIKDEWPEDWDGRAIQAELRRLHQVNAELLEALTEILKDAELAGEKTSPKDIDFHLELIRDVARAAIKGEQA